MIFKFCIQPVLVSSIQTFEMTSKELERLLDAEQARVYIFKPGQKSCFVWQVGFQRGHPAKRFFAENQEIKSSCDA